MSEARDPLANMPTITVVPQRGMLVDGELVEAPFVPQCKVCRSPYRERIELMAAYAYSYPMILEYIPEDDPLRLSKTGDLLTTRESARRIMNHFQNGHSAVTRAMATALIQKYAEEQGTDITEEIGHLLRPESYLHNVMQRNHEHIVDGLPVTTDQGLRAAATLAKIEADRTSEEVGAAYFLRVIAEILSTINTLLEDEDQRWLARAFEQNDTIREGMALMRAKQDELMTGE